ncbi:MAG: amidohydrolase [Actinomycetota bacterium]|nr:amidohydrolase [Actinomycetota bacterium]
MLLIAPVTAITMDPERRVIADAGILVDGAHIAAVAKAADLAVRYPLAHRLDGRGMVAIPGLIDTHSHADQSLLRGTTDDVHWVPFLRDWIDPWRAQRSREDLLAAYRLSLLEMVRSGTTCFLSPNVDPTDDLDALADVIGPSGLRAVLARWVEPGAEAVDAKRSLRTAVEAVDRWQGAAGGLIQMWFGLMVPRQEGDRYDPPFYRAVAQAARDAGTGIVYHFCSEIEDAEFYEATFGLSPVEWADDHGVLGPNVALINACWMWEREIEIVAATGTSVVYSPTATMKMATGVTPVTALQGAGANVSLGTDGGANNNRLDMIGEMKAGCLVQNVANRRAGSLSAEQALELATIGGARTIGRSDELGSLEVGKRADVVLVELGRPHTTPVTDPVSNLVYAADGSDVHTVLVDGRVLLRDRVAMTLDEPAVLAEARAAAARVIGRITPRPQPRWPVS